MLGAGFPAGVAGGWGGGEQQMWTQARQVMSGESLGDHPPPSSAVGLWPPNHPKGGCGGCRSGELGRAGLGLRAVSRTPHRAVSKNNTTFIGSWGLGCPVR